LCPRPRPTRAVPDPALAGRFAAGLDALTAPDARLGIAVSGGPDSLALLLLSSAARPGRIEAATVDHRLRPESADEARMVASVCDHLDIPHSTLSIEWAAKPDSAVQERARAERYRLLGRWALARGLAAIVTAHHLDDQAETLMMRLNRGSGARGLAGMRGLAVVPGFDLPLVRPLLGWRRSELEEVCKTAGVNPVDDSSNRDEQFERVRIRRGLAEAEWLDPEAIARSAAHLASADSALHWAAEREWQSQVTHSGKAIVYQPAAPTEIRRRTVARCIAALASEGQGEVLRGHELDRLVNSLSDGGTATLRGVLCSGGDKWRFAPAPPRNS
jgi:tRNA(Ile)-lysidine synthase